MKKMFGFVMAGIIAVAGFALQAGAAQKVSKIVLEGSTTVLPIAQMAAEDFMNNNAGIEISVRGGGSGVGITSLIEGRCDIADSSRAIKDSELSKAASKGISPKANVVAMDGIVVVAHPSNPVNGLTKQQVKDIFSGKISNWSEVGGRNEKIIAVSRDSASGTFEAFGELALHGAKVRPDALMQASNQAIAGTVSKTPTAIGYVGIGYISQSVKAIPVEGVSASKQTVLSGKYPYARPLFMYTNGPAKGSVKEFLDFVLSKEGQALVEAEGFIGLK
ncbi:MAG: phosphate ABC transporter substrate-binding protein [Elusimicrobia bacterium RIFOXYA1_FULL_47_7]|nr:MAG: phosphate ABC transporter substrate-binding protein [Elusimicrobia bacterium RIFOXYA12_FULL_49_49]OGS09183.1 MAG: phosphate ABC transporter substrate-binding protein [Elusimicrobia bacterium RIFOXYA1_FULL_47_7]OGS09871.1 MAG: phosphate ABC transporter substrate-binding protein [Elusimicrobia bacterium RIFOXYB1_FULL_48_9]OGS14993.1 MAG: phosphate ABC transporter substrate-binding protein [Elusimicrobia bacterium RIFOXYA2_FULL_47_53]OGS26072.1 MAG: phosphate ABC transporter substrate-bind